MSRSSSIGESRIGADDLAGVSDIVVEAALTAIMDLEDSVAAVDAADKVGLYRNFLGLMRGTISAQVEKNGRLIERHLADDRLFTEPDGTPLALSGRSLLLVRNVGHHMMTDAVLDADGAQIPETLLDAAVTALAAIHDLNRQGRRNSTKAPSIS